MYHRPFHKRSICLQGSCKIIEGHGGRVFQIGEELMQKPQGRKGLKVLVVQEVGQCSQVPWSLEGGDRGRR